MRNLDETDKFPETHKLPKLTQEETGNLNTPITSNRTESVIKKFPTNKNSRTR